jgi:hypothetical protein
MCRDISMNRPDYTPNGQLWLRAFIVHISRKRQGRASSTGRHVMTRYALLTAALLTATSAEAANQSSNTSSNSSSNNGVTRERIVDSYCEDGYCERYERRSTYRDGRRGYRYRDDERRRYRNDDRRWSRDGDYD